MANTLKQEIIDSFEGFGYNSLHKKGEYHRSSNMRRTKDGITHVGVQNHLMDAIVTTDLDGRFFNMAYGRSRGVSSQSAGNYLIASDTNGGIIQSFLGFASGSSAEYLHRAMTTTANHAYFMGVHIDPKGRLLYEQDRYLGMFDPYSATTNYITGTVAVTNGSANVVGTGTTFDAGMVGKVFRVIGTDKFYRVQTFTDATHITLNTTYTGTTASGASFVINVAFNDLWKDFGAAVSSTTGSIPSCPIDNYEDTVLFGRNNVITTLNVTTDTVTTDASPSFSLPTGYDIDHIVSNSNGILIGANLRGKGVLVLWDNFSDRSIAPWIWLDDNVVSICKDGADWIVITGRKILRTNGYSIEEIAVNFLDTERSAIMLSVPKNSIVIDGMLHFGARQGTNGLRRAVVYRFNLRTKLFDSAITRTDMNQVIIGFRCFEYSSEAQRLFVGTTDSSTAGVDWISQTSAATCGNYITPVIGKGTNRKTIRGVRIRIKKSTLGTGSTSASDFNFSFKLALKISSMISNMYSLTTGLKQDSANNTTLIFDNTGASLWTPPLGYEVEFAGDNSGSNNNCGYCRNIVSITGAGTSTETWTLDEALPATPRQNQSVLVTPFKLVSRKTISTTNGEIEEVYFDVKNRPRSRNFLLKVDIEDNTSSIPLEILPIEFVYEDEGAITT